MLCVSRNGGDLFVVGLPEGHGWERGDWIMLDVAKPGLDEPVATAMAVVIASYPDLVEVHMLYQRDLVSLEGAVARKIKKDDRARLGKFVGRITKVDLARVRIDVGEQDKALVGDVYQVLSPRDHQPIGRLQITEVGDLVAWGKRLDQREEFREGLDAVYLKDAAGAMGQPVLILVVNFDAKDQASAEQASVGRSFAQELADALANAARGLPDLQVRYDANERVKLGAGDEEGEKEARYIGKRFAADIVVWGSMRCGKQACAQPRFTVVEPDRVKTRGYKGEEIWMKRDEAGFSFKGTPPEDPLALGAAILGSVAYDARRHADAAYYLGQAVSKNVLRGEDELRGRFQLAQSMYKIRQASSARKQVETLLQRATEAGAERWEQRGREILAWLDMDEDKVTSARAHFEAIRSWATAHDDAGVLSHALYGLARLEAVPTRRDDASELYQQALDLSRRAGDVDAEAVVLHYMAQLEVEGFRDFAAARRYYQQSIDLKRRIGDEEGELASIVDLAILESNETGKDDAPRKTIEAALEKARARGLIEAQANILNLLAQFDLDAKDLGSARQRWTEAQALFRKLKMASSVADMEQNLAQLRDREKATGKVMEAWRANPALLAEGGALVITVKAGGQADKATLVPGDILLRYGQTRIYTAGTLTRAVSIADLVKAVTIELLRDGQKLTVQVHGRELGVELADLPPNPAAPRPDAQP